MAKTKDDVIILRPDELAEFSVEMVPSDEPLDPEAARAIPTPFGEDSAFESSSIDFWLGEVYDVQVPCDEPTDAVPLKPLAQIPANGKTKAAATRKKKAKRSRRPKS